MPYRTVLFIAVGSIYETRTRIARRPIRPIGQTVSFRRRNVQRCVGIISRRQRAHSGVLLFIRVLGEYKFSRTRSTAGWHHDWRRRAPSVGKRVAVRIHARHARRSRIRTRQP